MHTSYERDQEQKRNVSQNNMWDVPFSKMLLLFLVQSYEHSFMWSGTRQYHKAVKRATAPSVDEPWTVAIALHCRHTMSRCTLQKQVVEAEKYSEETEDVEGKDARRRTSTEA